MLLLKIGATPRLLGVNAVEVLKKFSSTISAAFKVKPRYLSASSRVGASGQHVTSPELINSFYTRMISYPYIQSLQ